MSSFLKFTAYDKIQYDHKASSILGRDYWRVLDGFRYYVGDINSNLYAKVPRGYLTDGASIPRVLRSIVAPWGKHGQAAIVHDFLCEYLLLQRIETTPNGEVSYPVEISRKECDRIFLESMETLEVNKYKRIAMFRAVSLFRVLGHIRNPTLDEVKFKLEVQWREENPI